MKASVVNKTTTTTTNTTTTTTGLKIDQLNNLLKIKQNDASNKMTKTTTTTNNHNSSVSLSNSHSRNLANLREVLELAHKLNQTNSFSSSTTFDHSHKSNDNNGSSTNEQSLSDLIDLLSSNNSTTNNNNNSCSNVKKLNKQLLEASKIQRPQPQQIINRIEKELEESLRLLKMYNGGEEMTTSEEKDEEDKELHEFDKIEDSSLFEEMIMTDRNHGQIRLSDDDEENETTSNDSAQSSSSPQSSSPPPSINVAAEKKPSFNRNDKIRKNCTINKDQRTKRKNRSPKEETTSQIESSCNKIVLSANKVETEPTKTETTISSSNEKSSLNSTNWNYDELNELKMKFISLLSSSNSAMLSEQQQQQQTPTSQQINILLNKEEKEECAIEMVSSPNTTNIVRQDANQIKQQLSPTINRDAERIGDDLTVPDHELQKIESFYQSFGTLLYLAKSCADLYTISNVHTTQQRSKEQAYNRNSIATSSSIREEYTSNSSASNNSSCSTDIKDECLVYNFIKDRYKNLISVRHRGLPLWLFNTGSNPRRPVRQLKFTLAEKGTGFILWQDRIDTLSSFKLFLYDKLTDKVIGIESLAQYNKLVIDNPSMLHSSTVVFKFRASDKKTNVLVRFDLSFEAVKFNEYFKRMICTLLAEVKQRAKSLPTGIGGNSSLNITTSSSSNVRLSKLHHQKKSSSDLKTYANRSTATMSGDSTIRLKRITKSDISTPCNLKHIISLKSNEKNAYYTLSKLLPTLNSSSTSSTTSSSKLAAMPSPISTTNSIESSSSILSSSCSPTSSSSASNISPPLSNNPKKTNRLDFVKVNNSTGSTSLFIHSLNINNSCYNNSLFLEEKSLANL